MKSLRIALLVFVVVGLAGRAGAAFQASDPGVGGPLAGLTTGPISQTALFNAGQDAFQEVEGLTDGLGPRFNLRSCSGCHAQPTIGGTSPVSNP